MKRHDYLPFGEELFAPLGGRTLAQGYATGDGVRQQFTAYERDVETNLDFASSLGTTHPFKAGSRRQMNSLVGRRSCTTSPMTLRRIQLSMLI